MAPEGVGRQRKDRVRAVDHVPQIIDEMQATVDFVRDDVGQAGLIDVAFDGFAAGAAKCRQSVGVYVTGPNVMTVFRAFGGVGEAHETGADDDDFHRNPLR